MLICPCQKLYFYQNSPLIDLKILLFFCFNFSLFHQSSGSGSESGIRTRKSSAKSITKNKHDDDNDDEEDDDEDDSHTSDDDVSMDLTAKGGSDNGSGTQVNFALPCMKKHSIFLNFLKVFILITYFTFVLSRVHGQREL